MHLCKSSLFIIRAFSGDSVREFSKDYFVGWRANEHRSVIDSEYVNNPHPFHWKADSCIPRRKPVDCSAYASNNLNDAFGNLNWISKIIYLRNHGRKNSQSSLCRWTQGRIFNFDINFNRIVNSKKYFYFLSGKKSAGDRNQVWKIFCMFQILYTSHTKFILILGYIVEI